jgi:hypothetical protein
MALKIINFPDGYASSSTPPTTTLLTNADLGVTVCPLDITNKVDSVYLPSYVDDVLEYADLASFPGAGTTGKIYVSLDTNLTYRWSGSTYVEISTSKVLSVNGNIGVVTIDKASVGLGSVPNVDATNPANISQTASYRFVTDTEKATWNASAIRNDTYANLVTWATTTGNTALGFSTDTKILYYVVDNVLQEIDVMRTISGTITTAQVTVGTTAVRATVAGAAPSATRKRLMLTPDTTNTGSIYLGGSGVTTSTGKIIVGPDSLYIDWDASDYYLISDTASQKVHIIEVV